MAYILPERLLLVRPAFDLVLRRIRSLNGKIETPRYALQFGSRLHFKRRQACQRKPLFPFFRGPLFFKPLVFFFLLKCNLEPNCKHI